MADVMQQLDHATFLYNLTNHSITVWDVEGNLRLEVKSLPDTPGGFDMIASDDHMITINNPNGVDFKPMHDSYEDAKAAGLEE